MRIDLFNQTYTSQASGIDIAHAPVGAPSNTPVGISFGVAPVSGKFYIKNYNAGTEIDASNGAGMILRGDFGGGITCHTGNSSGFYIQTDGNGSGGFNCNMDVGSPIYLTSGNSTVSGYIQLQSDAGMNVFVNRNSANNSNLILQNQSTVGGIVMLTNYNYLMHVFVDSGVNNRIELQNTMTDGDIYLTANRDIILSTGRNFEIGARGFRWFINTNNPVWGSEIVISEVPSNFIRISNYFPTGPVNKQYILLDTNTSTGNLDIVNDLPNPNNIRIINKQQNNAGVYCGLYIFGDSSAPSLSYGMDWVGAPSGNRIDVQNGSGLIINSSYGGGVTAYISSSSGWNFYDNAISNGGFNTYLQEGRIYLNAMGVGLYSGYGTSISNPTGMVLKNYKGYSAYTLPNSWGVNAGITISNTDSLVSADTVIDSGLGSLYNFALKHYMYAYSTGNDYADINIYSTSEKYSHGSIWIKREDRNGVPGTHQDEYIVMDDSGIAMHYYRNNQPVYADLGSAHFNFTPDNMNLSHSHPNNNHYGAINWGYGGNASFQIVNVFGQESLNYYATNTGSSVYTVWNATELLSAKQTYIQMTPAPNREILLYGNVKFQGGLVSEVVNYNYASALGGVYITADMYIINCDTTAGLITVFLPVIDNVTIKQGKRYIIKNSSPTIYSGGGNVNVLTQTGQRIDDSTAQLLTPYESIEVVAVYDGVNYYWIII